MFGKGGAVSGAIARRVAGAPSADTPPMLAVSGAKSLPRHWRGNECAEPPHFLAHWVCRKTLFGTLGVQKLGNEYTHHSKAHTLMPTVALQAADPRSDIYIYSAAHIYIYIYIYI